MKKGEEGEVKGEEGNVKWEGRGKGLRGGEMRQGEGLGKGGDMEMEGL